MKKEKHEHEQFGFIMTLLPRHIVEQSKNAYDTFVNDPFNRNLITYQAIVFFLVGSFSVLASYYVFVKTGYFWLSAILLAISIEAVLGYFMPMSTGFSLALKIFADKLKDRQGVMFMLVGFLSLCTFGFVLWNIEHLGTEGALRNDLGVQVAEANTDRIKRIQEQDAREMQWAYSDSVGSAKERQRRIKIYTENNRGREVQVSAWLDPNSNVNAIIKATHDLLQAKRNRSRFSAFWSGPYPKATLLVIASVLTTFFAYFMLGIRYARIWNELLLVEEVTEKAFTTENFQTAVANGQLILPTDSNANIVTNPPRGQIPTATSQNALPEIRSDRDFDGTDDENSRASTEQTEEVSPVEEQQRRHALGQAE